MSSGEPSFDVFAAASEGSTNLLRLGVGNDATLALKKDGSAGDRTALHHAAANGHLDAAQVLLEAGAQPDAKDDMGFTPLISAVSSGSSAITRLLIGAGADVRGSNNKGLTPLHYAASKGRTEIGRMLIDNGADINARDSASQLPLHRAASVGATPFIQLLTRPLPSSDIPKPRLNLQDRAGNTPLHLAVESGHAEAAVALIEAGADRQRTNSDGERPEEILGVGGQEARRVVQFIQSRCGPLDD